MTPKTTVVPVLALQTRGDGLGGALIVGFPTRGGAWLCEYPQDNGRQVLLSTATIEQCYPQLISGPGRPEYEAPSRRRPRGVGGDI